MRVLRRAAEMLLILAGGLACVYGALLLVSIGSSDTSTETLVVDGLIFVVLGVGAVAGGARLLYRRRPRT